MPKGNADKYGKLGEALKMNINKNPTIIACYANYIPHAESHISSAFFYE